MTTLNDLVEQGKEQGFLDYEYVEKVLSQEIELMPDQIEDIAEMLQNLGVEVRKKEGGC